MPIQGPYGFTHGINTKASLFTMPKDSLYTAKNVRHVSGSLQELYGTYKVNSTIISSPGKIAGIIANPFSPNSFPYLAVSDGHVYTLSGTGTANDISNGNQYAATNEGDAITTAILGGVMIIGDPAAAYTANGWVLQWAGSGNVTKNLTAPDNVIFITVNNIMFSAGSAANLSKISWSAVGDPTTWPAASNLTFRIGDADGITALSYIGTDVIIFKRASMARLSTFSTTIAGTTTLGPLTPISTFIGCCSPSAVDRLPDGRIVFLGSNAHAYIFDGSVIKDISDQPYPGPNVQALFDSCAPVLYSNFSGLATPGAVVCVYPPRSEIYFVISTTPTTTTTPGNRFLIYNYLEDTWFDGEANAGTAGGYPNATAMAYVPTIPLVATTITNGGNYAGSGNLVSGYRGFTYVVDDTNGTAIFPIQWNISIMLASEGRIFIPRSMLFYYQSASSSASFTVSYGFDGATVGNSVTISGSTTRTRKIIPIISPNTPFSTIQIQILNANAAGAGGGTLYEPIFLSDEVMI